jgi:NAD(P)H-dependent FMN reductase
MTIKIGIIIGSTRPGRKAPTVARWVLEHASERDDAHYELVDIADYDLPLFDETGVPSFGGSYEKSHTNAWASKISEFDGFIFVTPEYNHSVPGALKNAVDFINREWNNKAAAFVSYGGSAGGARAIEHLRLILAELQVATVRTNIVLPFASEFSPGLAEFTPGDYQLPFLTQMLDQLNAWSRVLQPLRSHDSSPAVESTR